MEIVTSDRQGILCLALVGNFDTTDVEALDVHIEEAVDAEQFKVLLITKQMRFINSAALGSLFRAQKRLQQFGGDIAVAELPRFAEGVFKTLGLDRKIRCFAVQRDALEYLRSGQDGGDTPGAVGAPSPPPRPSDSAAARREPPGPEPP